MSKTSKSDLDWLNACLKRFAARRHIGQYRIPALWNCWGYEDFNRVGRGEIAVDPYAFATACLNDVILPARGHHNVTRRSLSLSRGIKRTGRETVSDGAARRRGGDWIREATVYSTLIRATTAWNHDGRGGLQSSRMTKTGTFFKTILVLPLLARMGVNVIYMLPVSRCSQMFRKGEIGCPYSAKNHFELEPDLHDQLLGPDATFVDREFGAFIEAAHAMGMRVMVDLAPRTASRDCDWILDHPEWFYWIERKSLRGFGAPHVDGFKGNIPEPSQLGGILSQDGVRQHIAKFRHAPSITDPAEWKGFVRDCRKTPPASLYRAIEKTFGLVTPPGFSDCINDRQPPWSDVTFLRLYLDHPAASVKHLDAPTKQPPYVFTDSIKSSKFPGRRPNRALWKVLADILPFYQGFGIDGARVDMGHALPPELQDMLVGRPRRKDPDFSFLAEQFNPAEAGAAKRDGYNSIIGMCWSNEARIKEGELHELMHDVLPSVKLPMLATSEIPDCPRAMIREGRRDFARMTAVLNGFLPNGIPLINTGFEMLERQPMNLGLDLIPPGRFALPKSDPYYGKVAYFDRVALHWANTGAAEMIDLLERVSDVRSRYLGDLTNSKKHFLPKLKQAHRLVAAVGWRVARGRQTLLVVVNADFKRSHRVVVSGLGVRSGRASSGRNQPPACEVLIDTHENGLSPKVSRGELSMQLKPGEAKVILV